MILINTEYISFTDNKNISHRLNGPAYINNGSYRTWWIEGNNFSEEEYEEYIISLKKLSMIEKLRKYFLKAKKIR